MAINKRYTPNLKGLIHDCEFNFLRLKRLLPDMDERDYWEFGLEGQAEQVRRVTIEVTERSRYTITFELTQESLLDDYVPESHMTVRLYNDMNVAEVLQFQRNRQPQQAYPYPNKRMYQRDEKAQLNRFLGEWLQFCQTTGRGLISV